MNLTQPVLDLNFRHQGVDDICILKNSELLESLGSLECGIGSRHGKGHKLLKLCIRDSQRQTVC